MRLWHKRADNNPYWFIPARMEPFLNSIALKKRKRKKIVERKRERLTNHNFSFISDCCLGGQISSDLGQQQRSPFVSTAITSDNYLMLLKNLKQYITEYYLIDVTKPDSKNITGRLVKGNENGPFIMFVHYDNFEEAFNAWERRKGRINYDDLRVIVTDGFFDNKHLTIEKMNCFLELPYKNLLFFTNDKEKSKIRNPKIIYMKKYHNNRMLYPGSFELFGGLFCYERYIDIVDWLNN